LLEVEDCSFTPQIRTTSSGVTGNRVGRGAAKAGSAIAPNQRPITSKPASDYDEATSLQGRNVRFDGAINKNDDGEEASFDGYRYHQRDPICKTGDHRIEVDGVRGGDPFDLYHQLRQQQQQQPMQEASLSSFSSKIPLPVAPRGAFSLSSVTSAVPTMRRQSGLSAATHHHHPSLASLSYDDHDDNDDEDGDDHFRDIDDIPQRISYHSNIAPAEEEGAVVKYYNAPPAVQSGPKLSLPLERAEIETRPTAPTAGPIKKREPPPIPSTTRSSSGGVPVPAFRSASNSSSSDAIASSIAANAGWGKRIPIPNTQQPYQQYRTTSSYNERVDNAGVLEEPAD
jgi:hypothetical protein